MRIQMVSALTLLMTLLAAATLGCATERSSPAGFRLPAGDVARGEEAFVALKCYSCHEVPGVNLPAPVAEPPVAVKLGGNVALSRVTDGALVTAIIDPSHKIAPYYEKDVVTVGDSSRMAEYADVMTVRQLADLVAFLQSHYRAERPR